MVSESSLPPSSSPDPIFLNRLTALLSNEVFSDSTVARALTALKEEWMKWVMSLFLESRTQTGPEFRPTCLCSYG